MSDTLGPDSRQPLRVVHLIGRLSPGGGVQVVVRRLAAAVDPSQVDLHVVTMRPDWDDLSDVPATMHHVGFGGSRYRLRDRLWIMWAMARWVRRLRPDVVQLHSGMAWLGGFARLATPRTPFVLEVHDAPGSGRHGVWTDRVEGWCVRWLGMTAACHSSQVADEVVRATGSHQRVRRFPLGVDTETFVPAPADRRSEWRRRYGIDSDVTLAVCVGRPARVKRFDLAIDTVLSARSAGVDLQLVVLGGAAHDETLRTKVEALSAGAVVHMWDRRFESDADLAEAIASCDILCSTSEYEGFGLTLIEGMACGLPVVAMAVGGVTDIVVDGVTGYLVPAGDTKEFAERLRQLAESQELRSELGAASRLRAEQQLSVAAMAAAFTDLYRELSTTRGPRPPKRRRRAVTQLSARQ